MKFNEHPEYTEKMPEWEVYTDFYNGKKKVLVDPKYLIPHEFETTPQGQKIRKIREDRTEYTNYLDAFIKRFVSLIFRKNIDISKAQEVIPENEINNIDGTETTLENFLKNKVAPLYFLYGKVGINVDSPDIEARSRLEEQQLGVRPFLEVIDPREIIDWQYFNSSFGKELDFYVRRFDLIEKRNSALEELKINTYIKYSYLLDNNYIIETYKKTSKDQYELDSQKQIPLNFIPTIIIDSESWVKGAMPKARQLFNLESVLDNIHLFQAHQRVIATGDFKENGGQVAANEGNLLLLNGQGSITVVTPADTIAIERRIEQVKMDMIKVVFHQQRHLPADSAVAEGWQTMREAKEDFRSIAVNAAKDLQNGINTAIQNYLAYRGESVDYDNFVVLDTNVTETDVNEFMLWMNAFAGQIAKYPKWQKAVDVEAAKKMNLPDVDDIVTEIQNSIVFTNNTAEPDPLADILNNNTNGE